jgi:4,5-dihydroxyphthalate decarboxylase
MANLKLTMALAHYDRHIPFFDGSLKVPDGLDLTVLQVGQSTPLKDGVDRHERMIQRREFDIAEVSLSSYLMAKSRGAPLTAVPIFPRRLFSQSQIYVNIRAHVELPKDLIGKKVGLSSFQTTLSVLAKGDLQTEYGVPWLKVHWFLAKEENVPFLPKEGASLQKVAAGKKIGKMLEEGEIDALIMPHPPKSIVRGSKEVKRLFSDPREEELKYFRKNGYYPIMHLLAVREELIKKEPWLAQSFMDLFEQAKRIYTQYYDDPNWLQLAWGRHCFEEQRDQLSEDVWPFGIKKNRANLERFIEYSLDQGLIEKKVEVDDLFAESVRGT